MGISNFTLERIYNEIKDKLINAKIERIISISDNSYLLSLFKDNKSSNLLLSLDPSLPLILLSKSFKVDSINNASYQLNLLRKYLDKGTIIDAKKVKDDRIIIFKVKKWTQTYQLIETTMIFELFPLSPNIIFIDENYKIIDALKKSDALTSKHPIYPNLTYEFPAATNKDFNVDTPREELANKLSKSDFRYLMTLSEEDSKQAIINMFKETDYYIFKNDVSSLKINSEAKKVSLDNLYETLLSQKQSENKEEHFKELFKLIENKIKAARKKLINLEQDKAKFTKGETYKTYGETLYLAIDHDQKGLKSIDIEGITIPLEPKLTINENAQRYFKLYKKSKSGVIQVSLQQDKAKEELLYFENIEMQLRFASFKDIDEIILDLKEHHYIKDHSQKKKTKPGNYKYQPHFVTYKNVKYGYGLSSFQNEELTFSLASYKDTYMHIKDYHGPHVIIFSDSIDDDHLLFGGEIALYFASKTAGEVYYTLKKDVKKVVGKRGLVTLKNESVLVINKIREESLTILKNSH